MNSIEKTILLLVLALTPFFATGQTLKEANDAYSEASKIIAFNKEGTIELFEKALNICKSIGTEGDTLRWKIEGYMAGLYFEVGNTAYKDKKYEEVVPKLRKAQEVANLYKDESYKQRSTRLLANTYLLMGNNALKNNLLDTAIIYYQASFSIEPKASIWFSISQIYLKKGNEDKMTNALDKAIELGKTDNDTATINKAGKLGRQYYFSQASAIQTKNAPKAIELLNKAVIYDPKFADAYYMKTLIAYKLKRWQEAADAANLAIANETDSRELPKIYFKLGWIYVYLKNAPDACSAFKQASKSKDYTEEAKLNMKNLKCN
jgi:tetratricopeptide (TPR) repeat protein